MSTKYAVTIKCVQHGYKATESETLKVFCDLLRSHQSTYTDYVFENDSLGRVHLHSLMNARKNLLRTKFKVPYWHIHIQELETAQDISNWITYMHKDIVKEQAEIAKSIKTEYPFIDSKEWQ